MAADWQAPVERNRHEVAWFRAAGRIVPASVPAILGDDPQAGAFAMSWLAPDRHPVWKTLLRDGTVDAASARAVGDVLGRIHAATADRADVAATFATDAVFHAIRLEPYLEATGRAHPDLAGRFASLVATTAATRRVLVHGDFSPKNLLIGPQGPVILDAECAWFGDPAFDLAFVLNHLLLKGVWRPRCARALPRRLRRARRRLPRARPLGALGRRRAARRGAAARAAARAHRRQVAGRVHRRRRRPRRGARVRATAGGDAAAIARRDRGRLVAALKHGPSVRAQSRR